jgi:hypothetical protein
MAADLTRRGLFREVNEHIRRVNAGFQRYEVFCECARPDCAQHVEVPAEVYEQVRSAERRFVVTPGHEEPEQDRIVSDDGVYRVVAA